MFKTDETPPAEIKGAAEKVARWFAEHNVTDWVLGRCASRSFAEQAIESDANKQYDRLLKLIQYYVQVMWLVFGAFLLAETVLLGAVASIAKKGPHGFMFGAALLGLLLTLPWWTSCRYNHALYRLRVAEALALEPKVGRFFTTGADLIAGKAVPSTLGVLSIPWLARFFSPFPSVVLMIVIFFVAFVFAAVYGYQRAG